MAISNGFCYLPVSSREIRRELYVTSIGRLKYPPGAEYPAQGHPNDYAFDWKRGRTLGDFAIVWIERGNGEFEARVTGRTRWREGEILLLPPGVWHRYRPTPESGWTERWLCLNGDFLFRLRAKGLFPARPLLRAIGDPRAFAEAWRRTRAEAKTNTLRLAACALEVLALALEGTERGQAGAAHDITPDEMVNKALEFIWYNCHRSIDVPLVAQFVQIGRRTLERRFGKMQQRNVAREIEWARLQRARQLLGETDISIKEVGYAAGFSGPARLGRVFRARFKTTPGRYRALCLRGRR